MSMTKSDFPKKIFLARIHPKIRAGISPNKVADKATMREIFKAKKLLISIMDEKR
jgi:hypothetical protein